MNTFTPGISSRSGSVSTYVHAGMKNTTAQSVGATFAGTKQYDAFGLEVSATGTWQTAFGYAGNFGYQETDAGLKLLGNRYYDAETGRFLTRDPIKDGRSWYGYCDSEPIAFADDLGLRKTWLYGVWRVVGDAIEFVRFGITRDVPRRTRETERRFGQVIVEPMAVYVDEIPDGVKHGKQNKDALADERMLVEEMGGPGNHEPWSRSIKGGLMFIFGLLTIDPATAAEGLVDLVEPHTDQAGRGYRDWNWGGRAGLGRGTLYRDIFGE